MNRVSLWLGRRIGAYLNHRMRGDGEDTAPATDQLAATLRPGDVLLVEGDTRISVAIKYLTQSTWSHAALYVGDALRRANEQGEMLCFVEANIAEGVRAVPLSEYQGLQTRICRAKNLSQQDIGRLLNFACERIGHQYDLRNVIDLARYLLPTPPVPERWRRRMLELGSGDPTRAICSTLIAAAFQSVRYPILPIVKSGPSDDPDCPECTEEFLHMRHHSLFVPRDFDLSPYFEVVKPTLAAGFDPYQLNWAERTAQV